MGGSGNFWVGADGGAEPRRGRLRILGQLFERPGLLRLRQRAAREALGCAKQTPASNMRGQFLKHVVLLVIVEQQYCIS